MVLPNYHSTPEQSYADYRKCIHKLWEQESQFQVFRASLPPVQREILDGYLQTCEELDRITAQMAYHAGVKQGRKDAV